jgi:hypothetical protein
MTMEKDKIAKAKRELVTQLTARGTPSLTAIGTTSVAPGQLESISSTVDATDVDHSSGNMMDVDPSSGNMMDAVNLSPLEAPGEREPVSYAIETSSTVNVIDDEGSELSILEIDISDAQIAAARQAIEMSKIQAELADDAETMLRIFLNPARAATDYNPSTRPCVTEEQVRSALSHREEDFTNHQAMGELVGGIMELDRLDVFANQLTYESGNSLPDELHLTVMKKK